jgi:hypothetical protein
VILYCVAYCSDCQLSLNAYSFQVQKHFCKKFAANLLILDNVTAIFYDFVSVLGCIASDVKVTDK